MRRPAKLIRSLSVVAAVVLLFYAVAGYLRSADMFGDHPRWRGMNKGPTDFGLTGETVSFHSTDGVPLKAWWLPASGASRAAVIIAHGIDHTRQVMLPRAVFLVHGGYDALVPDLRGHGESGGTVVSPGLLEARDILGGVSYLHERGYKRPIAVSGLSYGAVAALIATAESPDIAAVISDGAYPTGKGVSDDIARYFVHTPRVGFPVRAMFAASSLPGVARSAALVYWLRTGINLGPELLSVIPTAERIRVPALLISGERDWIVPTEKARQVFSAIPDSRKQFLTIPGAVHDTTYTTAPALYADTVLSFLNKYL